MHNQLFNYATLMRAIAVIFLEDIWDQPSARERNRSQGGMHGNNVKPLHLA